MKVLGFAHYPFMYGVELNFVCTIWEDHEIGS